MQIFVGKTVMFALRATLSCDALGKNDCRERTSLEKSIEIPADGGG